MDSVESSTYHHKVYLYLLRRYLEQKYFNQKKANRKFYCVMSLLNQIDYVAESLREVYGEILHKDRHHQRRQRHARLMDPVLVEIYQRGVDTSFDTTADRPLD